MDQPVAVHETGAPVSEPERRAGGPLNDVLWILGTYLVLGVVGAVLWWLLVDPALFTKAAGGGLTMGEAQLGRRFADEGWYAVIGAVLGLLSGSALTWWRSRDPLLTAVGVLVGTCLAAGVMAGLGLVLGPPDPGTVAAHAAVGAQIPVQLKLGAKACYLVWPIAGLIGTLFVLWSPPSEPRA